MIAYHNGYEEVKIHPTRDLEPLTGEYDMEKIGSQYKTKQTWLNNFRFNVFFEIIFFNNEQKKHKKNDSSNLTQFCTLILKLLMKHIKIVEIFL